MPMSLVPTIPMSLVPTTISKFSCLGVGFYPHPSDCSQFYRCSDLWSTGQYQQYVFNCAPGTVFDSELGLCSWPAQVEGCGGEEEVSPTIPSMTTTTHIPTTTTTDTFTTPSIESDTTISPMWLPSNSSVFKCDEPGIVDDQEHCNKFWLCKEEEERSGVLEVRIFHDLYLY